MIIRVEGGTKTGPNNFFNFIGVFAHIFIREYCSASVFKFKTEVFLCKRLQIFTGGAENMASDVRIKVTLACTECKQRNYDTTKNKRNDPDRLELRKYCKFCRKHTAHKETK